MIRGCNRCNNSDIFYECHGESVLIDNNTYISKDILEENKNTYYKDNITNKYISCSTISKCITCLSSTLCTSCQEGFTLNNNNQCYDEKNNINNDDEKKSNLSTRAIIGIVFGCLGFLLIVAGIVYFLMNKVFIKKNEIDTGINNKIEINEGNTKKVQDYQENATISVEKKNTSSKRSIHNV